jgi:hypothetical protein
MRLVVAACIVRLHEIDTGSTSAPFAVSYRLPATGLRDALIVPDVIKVIASSGGYNSE